MNGANYNIEILWRTQRLIPASLRWRFKALISALEIYEFLPLSTNFHDNLKSTITHKLRLGVFENTLVIIFLATPVPLK